MVHRGSVLRPTSGWVPFQGAGEEALVHDQDRHLPWWPVNSIPGEENLYCLQEAQSGCLARADVLPSCSRQIYHGMLVSQLGVLANGVENGILVGSLKQRKRLIDTCHFYHLWLMSEVDVINRSFIFILT